MTLWGEEEEGELFRRFRREPSLELRDRLFTGYSGLVEAAVRRFQNRSQVEIDDLRQVGYLGLLTALERFDPELGHRFSTYATHRIEGALRHYLRDKSETVRRPRWMIKLSSQVAAFLEGFFQENERLPTLSEISEALNIEQAGVVAILNSRRTLSLDDEGSGGEAAEGASQIRSLRHESFQLPVEDRIAIAQAFEKLLEVEQKVVYLFFVQDLTQKQIATRLSLTPKKVSRLMQKALERLRGGLQS